MDHRRQALLLTVGTVTTLAAAIVTGTAFAGPGTGRGASYGAADCGTYAQTGDAGTDTWTVYWVPGGWPDVTTGSGRTGRVTGHREYAVGGYTFTVTRFDIDHKQGTWTGPDGVTTGTFALDRISREGC